MKPVVVTAIALLSFAAGWVIKPTPDAAPDASATANGASNTTRGNGGSSGNVRLDGKSSQRPLVLKQRGTAPAASDPELVSAQARFQENFGNAADRAQNARLSRLTEALGLSEEQRQTLAVLLANRRDGFRDLQSSSTNPVDAIQQAGISEQAFMEDVKKLLDPEQVAALDDFKQRESDNRIEAKAQRDVADLIGLVDLSEDQREQALGAMREISEAAAARRPAGWALMNESFGMVGPNQASVLEDLGDVMDDPEAMQNPQEVQRRLIEAQRATAEVRVSALKGILTPAQLAQYRSTLEARSTLMEGFTPPPLNPPR
ncbi:hypothetical protein OKA04_16130 [Luteolibacter flavescens]|uniref:Uncharacterized protein n=1 Tax=Luteolibacter flavescens TaxID=1859460 RepID=A0ABT3FSQ0_9BACT|nr:hypothetical protein [Luteolibacter flavescens]MCW1886266.1 hypothetical protein [Luteolibacter flavescens]